MMECRSSICAVYVHRVCCSVVSCCNVKLDDDVLLGKVSPTLIEEVCFGGVANR